MNSSDNTEATTHTIASRRMLITRIVVGVLVVATILILGRALLTPVGNTSTTGTPGAPAPLVGHYAPDATLLTLANQRVDLTSLRGKVVVLNFWYVACEPCRYEMPALEKAYQTYQGQGLVVVGVNITDDAATISQFTQQLGITYPIWRDANQRATVTYRLTATPSSFIIDRQGVIRYKAVGPLDTATLKNDLTPLLQQK